MIPKRLVDNWLGICDVVDICCGLQTSAIIGTAAILRKVLSANV